jgi:adenine-specific DNA-methyltransferase
MPTLNWLSKENDLKTANKVPYKLLEELPNLGAGDKDTGNMLIQGDNLEALKALLPFYAGQVKCIYIDPPYNTGARIDADGKQVGYDDNLEHTIWLSMMYPRLLYLRDFLLEDGLLAVQIDDNEFAKLYLLLMEIFGEKNLKTISVKMSEATGVKMASVRKAGSIPKMKEFIILAKKNGIRGLMLERVAKEKWDDEYKIYLDGITQDEILRLKEIIEKEDRTHEDVQEADKICAEFSFSNVETVMRQQNISRKDKEKWCIENSWRILRSVATTDTAKAIADAKKQNISQEKAAFIIETVQKKAYVIRNDYEQSAAQPRIKLLFADDYLTVGLGDLWTDIKTTGLNNEGGIDFKKGKKPERLVQRIISMSTAPGDLVLDSFLGSGTTAAVALKMGRRFIGIEMGEQAQTHCAVRLKKVIDGEQGGISKAVNWQGGGGFRFYKLGKPVFDSEGRINEGIKFCQLAAHVWFSETKTPFDKPKCPLPFLGVHRGTAYALLYNGILHDRTVNGGNVLTSKTLQMILDDKGAAEFDRLVIYGECSRIGEKRLKALNIVFKQIPYDLKR